MNAVNILITNAGNILRFLKEFTVDSAKDVSITYINTDGTESVSTFANIAKMVATYNITNNDGVIRDMSGNVLVPHKYDNFDIGKGNVSGYKQVLGSIKNINPDGGDSNYAHIKLNIKNSSAKMCIFEAKGYLYNNEILHGVQALYTYGDDADVYGVVTKLYGDAGFETPYYGDDTNLVLVLNVKSTYSATLLESFTGGNFYGTLNIVDIRYSNDLTGAF